MISRRSPDYLTGLLTPKSPQGIDLTNLTPLTPLRARDARENPFVYKKSPHVTRDPVIGVRLVKTKTYMALGVRYAVRWGETNRAEKNRQGDEK